MCRDTKTPKQAKTCDFPDTKKFVEKIGQRIFVKKGLLISFYLLRNNEKLGFIALIFKSGTNKFTTRVKYYIFY